MASLQSQVAAELFPIRYVCAFGSDVPDGVVPLDDVFASDQTEPAAPQARTDSAAAHVAAVTFDIGADGPVPVARNHSELIAGGLAPYLESGARDDAAILSAIPPSSFAGLALTVLPGPALAAVAAAGCLGDKTQTIAALWRSPERLGSSAAWRGVAALVDVASFGEIGLLATRRGSDGTPVAIPLGMIAAPRDAAGAVGSIETLRTGDGALALRGPMVPTQAFPPGAERGPEAHLSADATGYVESGFGCRLDRDTITLSITGPRGGITTIGGYRFRQRDVDTQVANVDPAATIIALPDALLGQRLAGTAPDSVATAARLRANGLNPLIAGAFRPRNAA